MTKYLEALNPRVTFFKNPVAVPHIVINKAAELES
jgi:hypothetical protein